MRSDGRVLPDVGETAVLHGFKDFLTHAWPVLHDLGLVRSDELPDLAARWLATDLVDTESVRMLAGHDPNDPWMLERLLADSVAEANAEIQSSPADRQDVAVDWVTSIWRETGNTRWAVGTLALLVRQP